MPGHIDLRGLFLSIQGELVAKLNTGRRFVNHPTAKGDDSESNWAAALCAFLPERYRIDRGAVIDSMGDTSDFIDIILFDRQYSPLIFTQGGTLYVPAESVYAVFEVKQEFSRETLLYSGEKAASVRRLHRTSAEIPHAGGVYAPRELPWILGGILALESSWQPPLGQAFADTLLGMTGDSRLDIGCAIQHGAFDVEGKTEAPLRVSSQETGLIFFLLSLMRRLQRAGTAPAIDLLEYAKRAKL